MKCMAVLGFLLLLPQAAKLTPGMFIAPFRNGVTQRLPSSVDSSSIVAPPMCVITTSIAGTTMLVKVAASSSEDRRL